MSLGTDKVVSVTSLVLPYWLFFVDDPLRVVDHVLEGVLAACQVQRREPLVSIMVELHLMALLPVVKCATKLNCLVSWSPVVQVESVGGSFLHHSVELRGHYSALVRLPASLRTDIHIVKFIQVALFLSNDLVDDVDRLVEIGVPFGEQSFRCFHLVVVNVDFASETAEFLKPRNAHGLPRHSRIERILSQL